MKKSIKSLFFLISVFSNPILSSENSSSSSSSLDQHLYDQYHRYQKFLNSLPDEYRYIEYCEALENIQQQILIKIQPVLAYLDVHLKREDLAKDLSEEVIKYYFDPSEAEMLARTPTPFEQWKNICQQLLEICEEGTLEQIKELLKYGAYINWKNKSFGDTPLIYAANGNRKEIVELLLQLGAEVNTTTFQNYTALAVAAEKGYIEIVTLLLTHHANPNIKSDHGTALKLALKNRHTKIAELLKKHGAIE